MSKKIYSTKPLSYRQWRQIRKEMYQLVFCIAALIVAGSLIEALARLLVP